MKAPGMLRRVAAQQLGLTIDTTVYPNVAYLGPRFMPTIWFDCMTETEEKAIDNLLTLAKFIVDEQASVSMNLLNATANLTMFISTLRLITYDQAMELIEKTRRMQT